MQERSSDSLNLVGEYRFTDCLVFGFGWSVDYSTFNRVVYASLLSLQSSHASMHLVSTFTCCAEERWVLFRMCVWWFSLMYSVNKLWLGRVDIPQNVSVVYIPFCLSSHWLLWYSTGCLRLLGVWLNCRLLCCYSEFTCCQWSACICLLSLWENCCFRACVRLLWTFSSLWLACVCLLTGAWRGWCIYCALAFNLVY